MSNRENESGTPPPTPEAQGPGIPPQPGGPGGQGDPPGSPENSVSVFNGEGFVFKELTLLFVKAWLVPTSLYLSPRSDRVLGACGSSAHVHGQPRCQPV